MSRPKRYLVRVYWKSGYIDDTLFRHLDSAADYFFWACGHFRGHGVELKDLWADESGKYVILERKGI